MYPVEAIEVWIATVEPLDAPERFDFDLLNCDFNCDYAKTKITPSTKSESENKKQRQILSSSSNSGAAFGHDLNENRINHEENKKNKNKNSKKRRLITPTSNFSSTSDIFIDMSSPPKRLRLDGNHGNDNNDVFRTENNRVPASVLEDPERTPRQPQRQNIATTQTRIATVLNSSVEPLLSSLPSLPSDSSSRSRGSSSPSKSPSKRKYQTIASLSRLARPVRVKKVRDLWEALPDNKNHNDNGVRALYQELVAVENKEEILPAELRDVAGAGQIPELARTDIRPFMWRRESTITSTPSQATADDHDDNTDEITAGATAKAKAVDHHRRMMRLIDVSIESANMSRSEAACNIIVHYPVLQQFIEALSLSSLIQVEPIMAAQIAPCFRPTSVSSHSTTISQSSSLSAHKMVDFALVLRPDGQLQQLIAQFLARPDSDDTINQTLYPPLTTRPAPVFIETKGPGGTPEAANVQLSIWVAAWHERIHSIMGLRGTKSLTDRVITLPVIEVMSGVWHLLFAVDAESEIQLLDRDFRIGDTNSVVGMYQLQAALSSLARWIDIGFKPWITKLLSVVVDT